MVIQRAQHNKAESPFDLNVSDGQHGIGVYGFIGGDKPMKEYYTKNNESLYQFEFPNELVKDLSDRKFDYWEARTYIYNNPQYKAFIFKHKGFGIPTSKEIVITDVTFVLNFKIN